LAAGAGVNLLAIFCAEREPNRRWKLPPLDFGHTFLRERLATVHGRYIHNNPDVIASLKRFEPDVVVTGGFNPTHLYAFGYSLLKRVPHVPMTDGTDVSEQGLSSLHRCVRRFVYSRSRAFVASSTGGLRLYTAYGIAPDRCFKSCLCVDNTAFAPPQPRQPQERRYDFLFCGRIEEVKNPLFALDVAVETAKVLGRRIRILFVGAGAQEDALKSAASMHPEKVEAEFRGFADHEALPALYRSARVFLFPSLWDPWGVVVNEAGAAGLPSIVSPHAGAAGELLINNENGFVCQLNAALWAKRAATLLTRDDVWQQFSECSLALVREYTYDNAAAGLLAACRFSVEAHDAGRAPKSS
jgi:glycosyltransferase involved in cell wall biosynthesis